MLFPETAVDGDGSFSYGDKLQVLDDVVLHLAWAVIGV
jgi:hypothetical protein